MSKLWLNKEIYSIDDIIAANQMYSNLAIINCIEKEHYYFLSFENCYYAEELTMKEYENYLIDLMISKNGN